MTQKTVTPGARQAPANINQVISQSIDSVLQDQNLSENARKVGRAIDSIKVDGHPGIGRMVNVELTRRLAGKTADEMMAELANIEAGGKKQGRIEDVIASSMGLKADDPQVKDAIKKYFDAVAAKAGAAPATPTQKTGQTQGVGAERLGEGDLGWASDLPAPKTSRPAAKPKAGTTEAGPKTAGDAENEALALNNEGVKLYNQGDYRGALGKFDQARKKKASTINLSNMAHAQNKQNAPADVVLATLDASLAMNGDNAHALNLRGVVLAREGDDQEALRSYEAAVAAVEQGKWKANQQDYETMVRNRDACRQRMRARGEQPAEAAGEGTRTTQEEVVAAEAEGGEQQRGRGRQPPGAGQQQAPRQQQQPPGAGQQPPGAGQQQAPRQQQPLGQGTASFIDRVASKMTKNEVDAMLIFLGREPTLGEVKYTATQKKALLREAYTQFVRLTPEGTPPQNRPPVWKQMLESRLDPNQAQRDSPIFNPAIYGRYQRSEQAISEAGNFIVERLLGEAEYFTEKVARAGRSMHDVCHRNPVATFGASLVPIAAGALFLL